MKQKGQIEVFAECGLPDPARLENWINPEFLRACGRPGSTGSLMRDDPFPHAILPRFLKEEVFRSVSEICGSITPSSSFVPEAERLLKGPGVAFEPIGNRALLRFLYGNAFRGFLSSMIGEPVLIPPGTFPELRRFPAGSPGMRIHTDQSIRENVSLFLQLTKVWKEGCGGELCLWKRRGRADFEQVLRVPPEPNVLVLMRFSEHSYHSVARMTGDWVRDSLLVNWMTGDHAKRGMGEG